MCGILGVVGKDASELLDLMMPTIKHRGPDSSGKFIFENLALGHHRLAILDLSERGHQPMTSADGRYTITYNGEIYNHLELREELKDYYTFNSTTDTETILYGFAHFGSDFFKRLNGIFALAIFDKETSELTIARDHFGVKPLYYYQKDNIFLFASELKAFLPYENLDKSLDYEALLNYITLLWSPGEKTPYKYVKKLLPAHTLSFKIFECSSLKLNRFYQIPFDGTYLKGNEADIQEEFEYKFTKAIQRQLLSDVPVGFFLSGGLDSSSIVAIARHFLPGQRLKCFTISTGSGADYEGFKNNIYYARQLAKIYDLELIEVGGEENILSNFDAIVYDLDEPQADLAPLHVYNIAKAAKDSGIKVLLGGTGGDDVLSGYRRHQMLAFQPAISMIPQSLRSILANYSKNISVQSPNLRRLKKLLSGISGDTIYRMANSFLWLDPEMAKRLFNLNIQETIRDYTPLAHFYNLLNDIPDELCELNRMLFWEQRSFLVDHNLNYTDKMSMAHGVETRIPFLDIDLFNFCCKLPKNLKMRHSNCKWILKQLGKKHLPHDLTVRKKSGFGSPLRQWIKQSKLQNLCEINFEEIFSKEAFNNLMRSTTLSQIDGAYSILAIHSISMWLQVFNPKSNMSKAA